MEMHTGSPVGQIIIGDDTIALRMQDRSVLGSLNNSIMIETESEKKFQERAVPIVSMVVADLSIKNPVVKVYSNDSYKDLFQNILKQVNKSEDAKVMVLEVKPDEMQENIPRQFLSNEAVPRAIKSYCDQVKDFSDVMEETSSLANILLKTQLPRTMWGAKKVQSLINNIRADFDNMADEVNDFEAHAEATERDTSIMLAMAQNPGSVEKHKANKIIDDVKTRFTSMKNTISKTAQALYGLFDIDPVVKASTGYPTTWFFDSSIFYDFTYDYNNLIKNLIKAAKAETEVIAPLSVWKVRILGEPRCLTI